MEKSTIGQLLDLFASGQDPELKRSIEDLVSSEPGGADLLRAYEKEPDKNRSLLEDLLGKAVESSDSPVLKLILAALQKNAEKPGAQQEEQSSPLGNILESLVENLLEKPKPRRKTRPKSKSKSRPKTGASTKSKAKTGAKTRPKTSPSSKTKSKTGTKSRPKSGASTKSKTQSGTKSKPKTSASTKSKTKSKPKTQAKSTPIDLEE